MPDLRCPSKLHGKLEENIVEVKCTSRFCGAGSGVVVLHLFDTTTGKLLKTNIYKDPEGKIPK